LLQQKGVDFVEIDATGSPEKRREMIDRSGRFTFPQIFIGARHVGGCDDLYDLQDRGDLDQLLATREMA
jgi:glutaredoxin 3